MVNLLPIRNWATGYVISTEVDEAANDPSSLVQYSNHFLTIVVRTEELLSGDIQLLEPSLPFTTIPNSEFEPIGLTGFFAATRTDLVEGFYATRSDGVHYVVVGGWDDADSYLYAGGGILSFVETACPPCLSNDLNGDGAINGRDIAFFIDCYLADPASQPCSCRAGDFRAPVGVTSNDISPFVLCLVQDRCFASACGDSGLRSTISDCNGNGEPDESDIFFCDSSTTPELCDCNGNSIPDGCDITAANSADLNNNNIPDECESDCNDNDVPDDKDIADATSADCDSNGVPDECDQDCDADGTPDACESSVDCNANGIFDACEPDCDNDGIPNECELSGNDCNGNGWPDDCDISLPPPFNSLDCNSNGTPDECELAGNDCNSNGILDACDISFGLSNDTNGNGIPDECESQQSQGGGGAAAAMAFGGPSPMLAAPDPTEADWDAFIEWCWSTDFSEMSPEEVFEAIIDKQLELGLPLGGMFVE